MGAAAAAAAEQQQQSSRAAAAVAAAVIAPSRTPEATLGTVVEAAEHGGARQEK